MKKLIVSIVLLGACSSHAASTAPTPAPAARTVGDDRPGAADPTSAVREFMAAVKAQDLQAIGNVWGDKDGPARDAMPREQREKRELLMFCYLKHDRYDIIGDAPGPNNTRAVAVNIGLGQLSHSTSVTVALGHDNRWYVSEVAHMETFQDFCSKHG